MCTVHLITETADQLCGTPKRDGAFIHWEHDILPHWEAIGERHDPDKDELGSSFYPQFGAYSSNVVWLTRTLPSKADGACKDKVMANNPDVLCVRGTELS